MNIGDRFDYFIKNCGLKTSELVEKYGITQQYFSSLKKNEKINDTMCTIVSGEGGNLNWLFYGQGLMFIKTEQDSLDYALSEILEFFENDRELVASKLNYFLMERLIDYLGTLANETIASLLDYLVFIDGDPLRARPFQFFYIIIHTIVSKKNSEEIFSYKYYLIDSIKSYKVYDTENDWGFGESNKNKLISLIDSKFSESNCKKLIDNSELILQILKKKMPGLMAKMMPKI